MEERHLSLSEAAAALDISERTAYRWIKSGKLRAYKPGRDYWIPESAVKEVVAQSEVRPKAESSSSLEPKLFNGTEDELRELRLAEVAYDLLRFGQMMLLQWEAELPERARADDDEWLGTIVGMWHIFGEINYRLLKVAASDGLHNKDAWLEQYMARYMDVNAAIHRINAAIQGHAAAASAPDEGAMRVLEPLVGVE